MVSVHEMDEHGQRPLASPAAQNRERRDFWLLWFVVGMIACMPGLWEKVVNNMSSTMQWNGCLLDYVTKNCLG